MSKVYVVLDDGVSAGSDELHLYLSRFVGQQEVNVYNLPMTLEESSSGVRIYSVRQNQDLVRYMALGAADSITFGIRRGTEWLAATAVADGLGNNLVWVPGSAPILKGLYTGPEEGGTPYRAQLVPYGTSFDNRDLNSQPFTPRRVTLIPSNMLENEIVALTADHQTPVSYTHLTLPTTPYV